MAASFGLEFSSDNEDIMHTIIIAASADLGVSVEGASLGPQAILNHIHDPEIHSVAVKADPDIVKSKDKNDLRKNEAELLAFNTELYARMTEVKKKGAFTVMLGGDHAAAVPSALSSSAVYGNIGLVWIDAHADFNTFETTVTGNLHGLPLAAIAGFNNTDMIPFHHGNTVSQNRIVIVGARDIDPEEQINLDHSGVTVFSTADIRREGASAIMEKALRIAGTDTAGIHISYDLDVIDPEDAPGVSVPAAEGISEQEAFEINKKIIQHMDRICSFDLVELNPLRDQDHKTEQTALRLLNEILDAVKKL